MPERSSIAVKGPIHRQAFSAGTQIWWTIYVVKRPNEYIMLLPLTEWCDQLRASIETVEIELNPNCASKSAGTNLSQWVSDPILIATWLADWKDPNISDRGSV